uniref:H15 domain-containing protein n=1 Tax=Stegastes partitus TaxID=144197 RepID=A0A3B5AAX3_9TELE
MAEVAPAAPAAPVAPAKPAKKKATGVKPKKKAGPGAAELVLKAVSASKERKGVSYIHLKRYCASEGYDVEHNGAHLKRAIKSMVARGLLTQTKGTGASGSFKCELILTRYS